MNTQLQIWQLIDDSLKSKTPVMLLYVLESHGSSPGRQGFCMALNSKLEMRGSIGGGIMEHKFVEMAREQLKNNSAQTTIKKQIHNKTAPKNQSGMICSGEQTVFLYPVNEHDKQTVSRIIKTLSSDKNGILTLTLDALKFEETGQIQPTTFKFQNEETWEYKEVLGYRNKLFIIGAGHCALALSKLMKDLRFYITLFDNRNELNTFSENHFSHKKVLLNSYEELPLWIHESQNDYVVVMTFGYRTDDIALRALRNFKFKYLGVLGSKNKIAKMFEEYRAEGFPEAYLKTIHAPIGLPINSQTPEEIAVSIAAEIIKVKNLVLSDER